MSTNCRYGGQGEDTIYGGKNSDILSGNRAADWLSGNRESDTIYGGDGDDLIYGGKENDFVFGDLGKDTLFGDKGADTLNGGSGLDVFVLNPSVEGETSTISWVMNEAGAGDQFGYSASHSNYITVLWGRILGEPLLVWTVLIFHPMILQLLYQEM